MARSEAYGKTHKRLRSSWAKRVAAGGVSCARCGLPIAVGAEWDLGHDDFDRTRYAGPEHRRCNRRAGGRVGAAITKAKRRRASRFTSQVW